MILNFIVDSKKLPANAKNGHTVFFHSAKVANENISAVGAGNSVRTAKRDAARKLLYIFLYNYHVRLLEILESPPVIQKKQQ